MPNKRIPLFPLSHFHTSGIYLGPRYLPTIPRPYFKFAVGIRDRWPMARRLCYGNALLLALLSTGRVNIHVEVYAFSPFDRVDSRRNRRSGIVPSYELPRFRNICSAGAIPRHYATRHALFKIKEETVGAKTSSILPRGAEILPEDEVVTVDEAVPNDPSFIPILILCFFVTALSALDRVAMSVAMIPLSTEFHLTDTIKGQISSVFSVGYGLAILPCGLLVAALSPRLVMAGGVILWSLATIGTPLAAGLIVLNDVDLASAGGSATMVVAENVAPLLLVRALMGGAESVVLPAVQRILANWVPQSRKSIAVAGVLSGFSFGTVMAYVVSPIVIDQLGGWRGLFFLYGAIGLLWLVPWLALARDTPMISLVPSQNIDNEAYPMGDRSAELESSSNTDAFEEGMSVIREAPWKELRSSKAVWAMALAHGANNWGLYINLSWTPTFYTEQYGLSVRDSALLSILPSIAGAAGGLFAGSLADLVIERYGDGGDESRTNVRKLFQSISLLGPAACLLTLANDIPSAPAASQLLLTGAVGLQAFNAAGYGAATQEKASKWSGLLYSVTSLPGVAFGSVGVALTGQILDSTGQDWSLVWRSIALVDIVGATAFFLLYKSDREFE